MPSLLHGLPKVYMLCYHFEALLVSQTFNKHLVFPHLHPICVFGLCVSVVLLYQVTLPLPSDTNQASYYYVLKQS